jgi:Rha family phage regulatory protein
VTSLVLIQDGKLATTSRKIAAAFNIAHKNVLQAIERLECSAEFSRLNFQPSEFTNARGRTYQEYLVTEAGAMRLIMGFTGAKAAAVKEQFIAAFQAMQAKLAKQDDKVEWKMARLQGKSIRSALTDTLQDFVAYAKAQGSQNAERYYGSITLMEYKALSLIEKGAKVGKSFRDTLDGMQIATLTVAENMARKAMQRGMAQGLHYKEIYQVAKMDVERLADVVNFTTQEQLT